MKTPQKPTQKRVYEALRGLTEPPAKKCKVTNEHYDSHQHTPEFCDRRSKIWLTRSALKELNRRTNLQHFRRPSLLAPPERTEFNVKDIAEFEIQGGPDLSDLRGYPDPTPDDQASDVPTYSQSSSGSKSTTSPGAAKNITAYHRDFDQHLTDHGIYPTNSSQKPNLQGVRAALGARRQPLLLSEFPNRDFAAFQEKSLWAKDEQSVLLHAVPVITSEFQAYCPYSGSTLFSNLQPMTDGTISSAKPDIYYGSHPERLARPARDELGHHITPSRTADKPMAPNFFLEVKGPHGTPAVVERQARYNGAIGARTMNSLQNYQQEQPTFDGNPYTFSATYQSDGLKLYAHHCTAPKL